MKTVKKSFLTILPLLSILFSCSESSSLAYMKAADGEISGTSPLKELKAAQGINALPSVGEADILVVPIQFSDDVAGGINFSSSDIAALESAYFGDSNTYPSVSEYYDISSGGLLSIGGEVSSAVTLPYSINDALSLLYSSGSASFFSDIIDYVYEQLFTEGSYALGTFDKDNNGKIDGLVLNYSWPSFSLLGTSTGDDTTDQVLAALLSTLTVDSDTLGSERVDMFSWDTGRYSLFTGNTNESHFYINDIAQMMGVPSYLDTTGSSVTNTLRAPLAMIDMMDGYLGDHNPFTKYQLGWIDPEVYTPSDVETPKTITLEPGESVILSYEDQGLYGEYLMVEYYTPTGLNQYDSRHSSLYGRRLPTESGIRVYKVDSRLATELNGFYYPYEGEPDYSLTDSQGNSYSYYYAYSNSSVNPLSSYGITDSFPLVQLLSSKGTNRYMLDYTETFTADDLFTEGMTFGDDFGLVPGYYDGFTFDGNGYNGKELGIQFTVETIDSESATLTLERD